MAARVHVGRRGSGGLQVNQSTADVITDKLGGEER